MRKLMKDGTLVEIEAPKGSEELEEEKAIHAMNKEKGVREYPVTTPAEHRAKLRQGR